MRKPTQEKERVARVRALNVLDPGLDAPLSAVISVAREITACPVAYISFIESDKEFIRAPLGISATEWPRDHSITCETILSDEPFIVDNLEREPRFSNCFPVAGRNGFTFYAGFPLITEGKLIIGALCIADKQPHAFSDAQCKSLQMLASHIVSQLTLHNKLAAVQRTITSLEDSEQRFRRIADASPVLLWISDIGGNRTLSNQAWCDFTGLTQEQSLAECWRETVHPDDREVYYAKWQECVQDQTRFQHEFRLRHQSGTFRWVMEQAIPLFASNGRLEAYVSSCVDLSLRSSDELQYQHNEARFRAVSEAAPLGIVVTDSNGNCIYSNHKFKDICGLSAEESLGSGWLRSVHPDDQEEIRDAWIRATKTAQSFEQILRYQRPDGSIAWCNLKAASINSTDTVSGWVSTIEDISAKREAEAALIAAKQAAEAAMHSKSQFIANVSHEIRTPLTAIIGFADALREEGALQPAQNHCLDVILNNGRHLLTIINQILDIAKIDAGALTIENSRCDLIHLIEELMLMFAPTVSEKSLYLNAAYQWPLPRQITTDPLRLKQILINLLGNAVKFTSTGGITLGVSWDETTKSVRFRITDTGIGISSEQQQSLFAPFYQANDSITRTFGGTGLGLSISHRLIKALGGTIEVHSELERGSTFTFSIQSQQSDDYALITQPPTEESAVNLRGGQPPTLTGRILFADDALDNRRLVEHLLRRTGAEIVMVENGQQAIDAALCDRFDLILMDIQMPLVDGLTATRTIREAGINTPVIALSAGAMVSDIERALEAGCTLHLSKPFERNQFYDTLQRYMKPVTTQACAKEDPPLLSELGNEDPEMVTLIEEFVRGLVARTSEIEHAVASQEYERIAALAHKLKGSSGMYGYPELSRAAYDLEKAAKQRELERVTSVTANIRATVQRVRRGNIKNHTSTASALH
jgi:PAS domain S-box-containing protein